MPKYGISWVLTGYTAIDARSRQEAVRTVSDRTSAELVQTSDVEGFEISSVEREEQS